MDMDASETLRQLGGNKFIAMTGARSFVKGKDFIQFKLPKANNNIRVVKISLNPMDTYNIKFMTLSGKLVKEVKDIYFDQLQEIFTENTGLYTHL